MKRRAWLVAAPALAAQVPGKIPPPVDREDQDTRLPGGKSQQEEILKAEHKQSLKDAAELVDLAEQLKMELEKNDRHILSLASLKKAERIEKLARQIRTRLRRY